MKKLGYLILLFTSAYIFYSCKKSFLDQQPYGTLNANVLANQKGVESLLISAYAALNGRMNDVGGWESAPSNWVYGSVAGGEAHKGSDATDQPDIIPIEKHIPSPNNNFFNVKWRAVYEGVNRANLVLKQLAAASDVSDATRKRISGEARFLRAYFHLEAKKMWNNIPYIDENMTELVVPNDKVMIPNTADTWPQITADAKYAYDNLPGVMDAVGRANKYAAGALLGKIYMFQKKFSEARTVLLDVYNNGTNPKGVKFGLNDAYQDNFDAATKNSKESVFAVQSSVNDASGANNGNYGDVLNMPYNNIPFTCCGFFQPSQDFVNSFKTDANGLPDPDNYNANPVTIDNGQANFTPYQGTLDPRLDWSVGRRGIPYYDWGLHGGTAWQRDPNYSGPYSPKKNITKKSQQGTYTDASFWNTPSGITAINVNLIRFADVMLWLAECEAEVGTLGEATKYVNLVRARAALPTNIVYKYKDDAHPEQGFSTTPAANYKVGQYPTFGSKDVALKAIRFERKLELGLEGHRFFDLVRWGIAGQELNKYLTYEKTLRSYLSDARFQEPKDNYFPIPQRQIDLNPNLKQNPGY